MRIPRVLQCVTCHRALHVHATRISTEHELLLRVQLPPRVELSTGQIPHPATNVLVRSGGGASSNDTTSNTLSCLSNLEAFIIPFAGPPSSQKSHLRRESARRALAGIAPLQTFNSHHNAPSTAEMGVALLLAVAKRLLPADAALRHGDWTPRGLPLPGGPTHPLPMPQLMLFRKRALVIGLGAVGSRCASLLHALGMEVHAITLSTRQTSEKKLNDGGSIMVHPLDELHQQLAQATAVICCVPATSQTRHMISRRELYVLPKSSSVIVNVSRGRCIDAAAVKEALESGHLFGFGSDVWWQYPAHESERMNTTPWTDASLALTDHTQSTVLSPHRGGGVGIPVRLRMLNKHGTH